MIRGLRFFAAAVALHGVLFWLFALALPSLFPGVFGNGSSELIGQVFFWALVVPALILTTPFNWILWSFGLMNVPGWFAWPKPLGFALAYTVWIVVLLGLAWVGKRITK